MIEINLERLRESILQLAEIGKEEKGGITRLAYSKEYYDGINFVKAKMEEAKLDTVIDSVSNVLGTKKGKKEKIILVGSHTDTVEHGGAFDGVLGVLGAIEVMKTLDENNIELKHTVVVGNWAEEEGNVIQGLIGSGAFTGQIDDQIPQIAEKLEQYGMNSESIKQARFEELENILAYLELHIEQGGILDKTKTNIGVVSGIVGEQRYFVTVKGKENHAGTTPMQYRDDALTKAAKIILALQKHCTEIDESMVCTTGKIRALPGEQNIIPGIIEMTVEIRANTENSISELVKYMKEICGEFCDIEMTLSQAPVYMSKICMDAIKLSAEERGLSYKVMQSGAGHDAMMIANAVPNTGMIFVPSINGMSHCPEELTTWSDIENGTNVLLSTLLKLDEIL